MEYTELKRIFQKLKADAPRENLTAHIIFTEDSFDDPYPLLSRTYLVSSDNKAFWSSMFSHSIFAYCLDKTSDQGVRLDWYMAEEGNKDGWEVRDCYIWFFGDTCIRAREVADGGRIRLEPVSGDQTACGEWADLPIDRVYGYCTLLERHINGRAGA